MCVFYPLLLQVVSKSSDKLWNGGRHRLELRSNHWRFHSQAGKQASRNKECMINMKGLNDT